MTRVRLYAARIKDGVVEVRPTTATDGARTPRLAVQALAQRLREKADDLGTQLERLEACEGVVRRTLRVWESK